jgi:hypothetical protein
VNPEAAELAEYIDAATVGYLAQQLSIVLVAHPELPVLQVYRQLAAGPTAEIPLHLIYKDGTRRVLDTEAILRAASQLPGIGLGPDIFRLVPQFVATAVGDRLSRAGLMRTDVPLLQFARHLRNASAHGNRWHFAKGEPRYPAAFRTLQLDASLEGEPVFLDYLGQPEFVDFLGDLASYLRTL